jgi:hypothetical protein
MSKARWFWVDHDDGAYALPDVFCAGPSAAHTSCMLSFCLGWDHFIGVPVPACYCVLASASAALAASRLLAAHFMCYLRVSDQQTECYWVGARASLQSNIFV